MEERVGNKFERMMRIFTVLNKYEWISAEVLAYRLGVSKRTIFRYINDINIPFEESGIGLIESSQEGYRLRDTLFLDSLKSIDDQYTIAAISTSIFAKNVKKNSGVNRNLVEKLSARLYKSLDIPEEILDKLLKSFLENRIIEIEYLRKNGEVKAYRLLGLKLVLNSGIYYLQSYHLDSKIIQHFTLHKIQDIFIKEIFTDKKLIEDRLKYIDSRWGTFVSDSKNYLADVEFIADQSLYGTLKNMPLHFTQEYKNIDGEHHFFLKVHNALEFARWSMKFGRRIYVVSPPLIRNIIVKECNELLKRYGE